MSMTRRAIVISALVATFQLVGGLITTPNNFDPQPVYSPQYLNNFLLDPQRAYAIGIDKTPRKGRLDASVMPFIQYANHGTSIQGVTNVELGDLTGGMNVLGVLPFNQTYSAMTCPATVTDSNTDIPCGKTVIANLATRRNKLIQDICSVFTAAATPAAFKTVQELLVIQQEERISQAPDATAPLPTIPSNSYQNLLGVVSTKLAYRRYGARFNAAVDLFGGFGLVLCGGFSTITQTARYTDLTQLLTQNYGAAGTAGKITGYPYPNSPDGTAPVTNAQWQSVASYVGSDVSSQYNAVAQDIGYNIQQFSATGFEDLNLDLFWRHKADVQKNPQRIPGQETDRWPSFSAIPYASIGGTFAVAKKRDYLDLWSLPFGNNGHNALRARAGVNLAFYETVEVGGEVGFTRFGSRTINSLPVPTNNYQTLIFPYNTTADYRPGNNMHIGLGLYVYRALGILSASAMYVFINHDQDDITLINQPTSGAACSTTAFKPSYLASQTAWKAHLINATLNAEFSPRGHGSLFVQIPIARTNAYSSTTVGVGLEYTL